MVSASSYRANAGFTLVEVMVALLIIALALPALMFALNQQLDGTAHLRDRSLAQMVATNKLAEIRILAEGTRQLPTGTNSGSEEMAGRQWYWWTASIATEMPSFFRIEITVADKEEDKESPLVTLSAFMSADLELDDPGQGATGG